MKSILFICIVTSMTFAQSQDKSSKVLPGIIFSAEQSRTIPNSPFLNQKSTWTPETLQVVEFERLLPILLDSIKYPGIDVKEIVSNLGNYCRQYLGFIRDGKELIYVNAFCSGYFEEDSWKREFIFVFDGGSCFFQVVYDPKKKTIIEFSVNGSA
jgi:hypothetical protein